uniref:Uncharacterized protein n=1 Tax=Nelumbo nucifera TaxID=4432 RepID=A0A822ZIN7_NELNU|nr:TPA_asm: hypothetical protein HUJ06_001565 [Nelumbo nucifera]
MENAESLLVPLQVKLKVGRTWGSLEPFQVEQYKEKIPYIAFLNYTKKCLSSSVGIQMLEELSNGGGSGKFMLVGQKIHCHMHEKSCLYQQPLPSFRSHLEG